MLTTLIVGVICAAVFAAAFLKFGGGSGAKLQEHFDALVKSMQEREEGLQSQIARSKESISAKQIAAVQAQIESLEASIAQEKVELQKVEATLSKAQQDVEQRENVHQTQKIAKEDEEEKLTALLEKHEALAAESIQLERNLAESMKNLDKLLSETDMSESQKGLLRELQTAMEEAGARLRELISEYEAVKTRVETLRQQHLDLEEEYTRLVELQLG